MINVHLRTVSAALPVPLAQHAGGTCYQAEMPTFGAHKLNVDSQLFKVGHHTTLEHWEMTFEIEGIAVSDVTFGLHLTHPFYNSDQRSGRYCGTMFANPNMLAIRKYITSLWPDVGEKALERVLTFILRGIFVYQSNVALATETARKQLKKERPFATEQFLERNAPKVAQEQLRMFISTIFPTGLIHTIDLITLVSLYESAWSPGMRLLTHKMVGAVLDKFPELHFMFDSTRRAISDWAPKRLDTKSAIWHKPHLTLERVVNSKLFVVPDEKDIHPVDRLHFMPKYAQNNLGRIDTAVEMSVATMGQDQRHRTISRSEVAFTNGFYLPFVPLHCGLANEARILVDEWLELEAVLPRTLWTAIAPYGTVVAYEKSGTFNAVFHEQHKRLCWCAQEEIYNLALMLRRSIERKLGSDSPLLRIFEPPCYSEGYCAEGSRYCGRDIGLRTSANSYFVERKV